jgi:Spy/CpxP family protein refolding chaperone
MKTKTRAVFVIAMALLMASTSVNAQNERREKRHERRNQDSVCQHHGVKNLYEKIRVKKVGFMTQELNLTVEEAQKFWPIYDKYQQELMALRDKNRPQDTTKEGFPKRPDFLNMDKAEAEQMLDRHFKTEKEVIALQEKYFNEMKTAIPVQKVAMLFHIEKKFMREVIGGNWHKDKKRVRR